MRPLALKLDGWFYIGIGHRICPGHIHFHRVVRWRPWHKIFGVPFHLLKNLVNHGSMFYGRIDPETDQVYNGPCHACDEGRK